MDRLRKGRLWDCALSFLLENEGQATTEYIVMLAVVGSLLIVFIKDFLMPTLGRLMQIVTKSFQNQLFGADLHHFRVYGR